MEDAAVKILTVVAAFATIKLVLWIVPLIWEALI